MVKVQVDGQWMIVGNSAHFSSKCGHQVFHIFFLMEWRQVEIGGVNRLW
jgi:hypothetical protein